MHLIAEIWFAILFHLDKNMEYFQRCVIEVDYSTNVPFASLVI